MCFADRWQDDARPVWIAPKDQHGVADRVNRLGGKPLADELGHIRSLLALRGVDAQLDQFMVQQRGIDFCQHRLGDSGLSDDDHRLEMVAEFAQVTLVRFGEWHDSGAP